MTQLTAQPEKKSMADLEETLRHLGRNLRRARPLFDSISRLLTCLNRLVLGNLDVIQSYILIFLWFSCSLVAKMLERHRFHSISLPGMAR